MQTFGDELVALMPMLRRMATSFCRNDIEAGDLMQETLLRAWSKQDQFQPGTNLAAWAVTIMRNEFYSSRRRRKWITEDPDGVFASHLAGSDNLQAALEAKDALAHLVLLQPEQAVAVIKAAMGDQIDEIAASTKVAEGTVKSRIHRGRTTLERLVAA